MDKRTLGTGGPVISAVGLGCMTMTGGYGGQPDRREMVSLLHAAVDQGVTFFDTAEVYRPHANEELVGEALAPFRDRVVIATKFAADIDPATRTPTGRMLRPDELARAVHGSLRRLGVEAIGLYQLHKPDPAIPFEESVGALRDLLDAGTIRLAGISNTDVDQIQAAQRILGDGLVSVQNRYSPAVRDSEAELRLCAQLGLAFLPWSPLGGISRSSLDGPSQVEGKARPSAFHAIAAERGVSPQQVALAWLLARSPSVIPIPGASRPGTIRDSAAAADLELSTQDLARLNDTAVPARPGG